MRLEFFKKNDININLFLETYFEMVSMITSHLEYHSGEDLFSVVLRHHNKWGQSGLYDLAQEWTREFELKYKDIEWGVELYWLDTVEEFFKTKNNEKN